jgi:hypothetical protein
MKKNFAFFGVMALVGFLVTCGNPSSSDGAPNEVEENLWYDEEISLLDDFPANFTYTGAVQKVSLSAGKYKLEVWGAEGGKALHGVRGGYGGYSAGIINLTKNTTLNIYIGGKPSLSNVGGFNGGGAGGGANSDSHSGGGATDIRIKSLSLYSRVIVAGGGGSSGCSNTVGGAGGGLVGLAGKNPGNLYQPDGTGGTQVSGGIGGTNSGPATFGNGGNSGVIQAWPGGAGGGGWYGGGAGSNLSGGGGVGAGGSGWVYTAASFATWQAGNPEDAAQWQLNSGFYLSSVQTIAGDLAFPAPGGGVETGHAGNGYAKITKVE